MVRLCVIEGDGIGHEVVPAAVQVLRALLPDIEIETAEAGMDTFIRTGSALPESTLETARACGAVLFGAAQSPSYPVEGYFVPGVRLRQELRCYANLRPARWLPVPTAKPDVDLLVVRENTEDLYLQLEHTRDSGETGVSEKIITRAATERVARRTFEMAMSHGREKVTIVHKASVLPQTDGLFRKVAFEVAKQYPEIETDDLLVDTAAYWMVKDPLRFDVLLTPNLYGDILSDMAAAWGGGLGLAPSLNIGDGVAMAEPVHGCAPDIAGRNVANPTACIMSVALLLRLHWNMPELADRVENAVRSVLHDGLHTADINHSAALSTTDFTNEIIARL
ncbi:MAG: isocitrate/isopropylmalate dehydrogenase family protein [Pleurocapsa minor GSE-CHR-MK-17-07R]|jgi:homoisocitrate dehydrogenase|nr:isocitrate/isopropylmalate dehydrogenase family protein [Pleurocapsa minor GSE-CHR-MK 17-07R]